MFYAAPIPAPSFPTGCDNSTKGVPIALTPLRVAAEWLHPFVLLRDTAWWGHEEGGECETETQG
jgi:hypothetical protein